MKEILNRLWLVRDMKRKEREKKNIRKEGIQKNKTRSGLPSPISHYALLIKVCTTKPQSYLQVFHLPDLNSILLLVNIFTNREFGP